MQVHIENALTLLDFKFIRERGFVLVSLSLYFLQKKIFRFAAADRFDIWALRLGLKFGFWLFFAAKVCGANVFEGEVEDEEVEKKQRLETDSNAEIDRRGKQNCYLKKQIKRANHSQLVQFNSMSSFKFHERANE